MIDDLDRSLIELLKLEIPKVDRQDVEVSFVPPNREWRRGKPALNFFLYDVRENVILRHHQWQQVQTAGNGNGTSLSDNQLLLRRLPLRMDCHYMVSAWGNEAIDEHLLLTECLVALARYPVLNQYDLIDQQGIAKLPQAIHANESSIEGVLERHDPMKTFGNERSSAGHSTLANKSAGKSNGNKNSENKNNDNKNNGNKTSGGLSRGYLIGALQNLEFEIHTQVASREVMTNPAELWGSLENSMRAAFSYVVTLPINPWKDLTQVATATGSLGISFDPTDPNASDEDATEVDSLLSPDAAERRPNLVGGMVKIKKVPPGGIEVWLVENGMSTGVDAQGRFVFRRVATGDYTVEVRTIKGKEVIARQKATVSPLGKGSGHVIVINVE